MTIVSIGTQCITSEIIQNNRKRHCSFPFDWIISNLEFVYTIINLLLKNVPIDIIVKDHFYRIDTYVLCDHRENYFEKTIGTPCNIKYGVIFLHDNESYDEIIEKYSRRIKRLYDSIMSLETPLTFLYVTSPHITYSYTIDGIDFQKKNSYYLIEIYKLIKTYRQNFKIIVVDAIHKISEEVVINDSNMDINIYKITFKDNSIDSVVSEFWKIFNTEYSTILDDLY